MPVGTEGSKNLKTALARELRDIINDSHTKTWEIFDIVRQSALVYGPQTVKRWRSPGEPAFVSTLLENAVNSGALRSSLLRHLSPKGLCSTEPLVSGIFIHQKPKIEFANSKEQIELGDLLLVRHHFKVGADFPEGRAVLLQAKSGKRPVTGPMRKKEATQFNLYSDWSTKFKFPHGEIGSPPDGSEYWDFSKGPGHCSTSGEYGLVSSTRDNFFCFPDESAWAVGAAIPPSGNQPARVTGTTSLAEAFEGFLIGRWGRRWDVDGKDGDHWSSFVKECLAAAVGWRHYPVDRLDSYYPRRRDLTALCYALADVGVHNVFSWESSPPVPRWLREIGGWSEAGEDERAREQRFRARELMRAATKNYGHLDLRLWPDYGPPYYLDTPEWTGPPGHRGISVLYVATSGAGSLEEAPFQPRE
jgi:hypothetical protein